MLSIIKEILALMATLVSLLQPQPIALGGISTYTEVSKYTETVVSYAPISFFQNLTTGEVIKVPITIEEFRAIGNGQPKLEGYKWLSAGENPIVQMNPTILQDNQYYIDGADAASSTLIKLKLLGEPEKVILESSLNML